MATKSILKNITIRDKHLSRNLVNALEHAHKKTSANVSYQRKCTEIKGDKIKSMFGEQK